MALNHSPKIVTDGLVFAYDMANTQKSFKGAPVTNSQWNNGSEVGPWTAGGVNTDVTGTSQQGPVANAKTWKFNKTGSSSQWNGWESSYGGIWTGSAGDIWTTSYWYKTSAPAGLSGFGIGSFFTSDWSRAYNTTVLSNVSSIIADGQWHYNYTTVQFNEAYSNAIIVDGPSWGYSTQVGELFINGLQWNKNNYATQFAAGTRSNTQALIDLTGNNTITASSLTYASDGTFSFNGSSNKMTNVVSAAFVPSTNTIGRSWEVVVKPGASMTAAGIFGHVLGAGCTYFCNGGICIESGQYKFNWYDNAAYQFLASGVTATNGQYAHIIGTFDPSDLKMRIYVNGTLMGTSAATNLNYGNAANEYQIGYLSASGNSYTGKIDVCRYYYNKTLSAAEVKQNFNALRGRYGI